MNIGELILNLGIKGTEKTVGALNTTKKGLQETASLSLEAKAGIIGAMYALERLFATSGKTGTDLTNFNALMGGGIQTLQQYQYAARQVGVSNQEVEGSFKALQGAMTKTLLGEGAPKGLARVSLLTGGINQRDLEQYAKQPQMLIQKLQEYAGKETNAGLRNETLKSFGLGENMIAALSRNAFRPEVLKKAPTYSNNEVGQLDKANIAWSNLGNKIEMAVGHFNAKHGDQLVSDISKIVTQVLKLVEAFTKLTEKLHVFDLIGKAFSGWSSILEGVNSSVDEISGATKDPKKREKLLGDTIEGGKNAVGFLGYLGKSLFENLVPTAEASAPPPSVQKALTSLSQPAVSKSALLPSLNHMPQTKNGTQNNNVNINNHFQHPGTDHKKTADSMKQAIQQTYRQMSAQAQGS